MPINAKSTFVNMDLLNGNLQLNEFIHNDRWSLTSLQQFLSPHITPRFTSLGRLDLQSHNHWVWSSNTHVCNIVFEVYNTLNTSHTETAPWQGWKNIWRLNAAPMAKFFSWLLLHGRVKTLAFLNTMNLVPSPYCVICGCHREGINQLFNSCSKISLI